METDEQWKEFGEEFWKTPRSSCPATLKSIALACIRVSGENGDLLPISNLWLYHDSRLKCFGGLLKEMDRSWNDTKRKDIIEKLTEWDLWESWVQSTKALLKKGLPDILAVQLAENAEQDAFALFFNNTFEAARRSLDDGWKQIVEDALRIAVRRFVKTQMIESGFNNKKVVSRTVSDSIRAALSLLPEYVTAPVWLTDSAYQRIEKLGLQSDCDFEFLGQPEVASQQEGLARELLEKFYIWQITSISPTAKTGLKDLSSHTSLTKRRDWQLGLGPQKTRRLRDLIIPNSVTLQTTATSRLQAMLLGKAKWEGEPLPASLVNVVPLAEACIQPTKLTVDAIAGTLMPLESEQLPSETTALADIQELVKAGGCQLLGSPKELNLKWRYGGDIVARLDDAAFAIETDRIIVHQFRPPADEEQWKRVLAVFETNSTVSPGYQAEKEQSLFQCYQSHRD